MIEVSMRQKYRVDLRLLVRAVSERQLLFGIKSSDLWQQTEFEMVTQAIYRTWGKPACKVIGTASERLPKIKKQLSLFVLDEYFVAAYLVHTTIET